MADIKDQLIKDSYNYVLQCNFGDGIVYRIGGAIPVNPVFQSGLTVNDSFTYSNGTEQLGYVLTCDAFGNAVWSPVSAATPSSGVTSVTATDGLSGNVTTGAVTIVNIDRGSTQNIFKNIQINGNNQFSATSNNSNLNFSGVNLSIISNSANTLIFSASTGDTVTISGGTGIQISGTYPNFGVNFTGSTGISGDYLPLSGGTVTGLTIFNSGVDINSLTAFTAIFDNITVNTQADLHGLDVQDLAYFHDVVTIYNDLSVSGTVYANTISATTYFNYPDSYVTGFSLNNNTITLSQNRNDQYSAFTISLSAYTGTTTGGTISGDYLPLSGGTLTGGLVANSGITANTISATTYFNLPVSSLTSGTGIGLSNLNGNYTISYTGSSSGGTISGDYLPLSGGTVTGGTQFTGGLTANTISATTYQNLPVSGLTGGNNISVTGSNGNFTISFTGTTGSSFTGGTVSGATNFTGGLTANTISATTFYNLPVSAVTNGTGISASTSNGAVTITNIAPDQTVTISGGTGITTGGTYPNFTLVNSAPDQTVTITGGTNIQIVSNYPNFGVNFTGSTNGEYLPLSGGTVTGATIFQSGLTANTISATTYQNLPQDVFVTGGTYTAGSATFTNTTGGTFSVTGFPIGGGGGQTFYLNLSQTQNGNRLLSTTASTASEQTSGVTINNGVTGTIASFQSQPLNITLLPGGIWSFYLHSYKENNNATFNIFVELYKRTSGGTQTLLFTTDPAPVTTNSPNPSMQLSDGYFSGTPLSVSDSVVAVVRATNTSNQSHTITLVTEGSAHYSYVVSTIPTQQGLTCDTLSGCSIIQTIQTNITNKFDKSGGTVSGATIFTNGLTANTISATTYQNLPVSGLTGGDNISVTGSNGNFTISFTGTTGSNFTGGTVSGATIFTDGLTANTISATTYQNLPVSAVTNGDGISASTSGGVVTITNTRPQGITGVTGTDGLSSNTTNFITTIINIDKGSSQNIFKNIQIGGVTQFSANSNNSDLNFSGIGITITSAATNTLVFTNQITQGITGITSGDGITATTSDNNVTITNLGVTGITAGYGISASTSTGNVVIIQQFDYGKAYTTGNNLNFI
jgi:hypothetical protein